ncbi:MAG: magnesium transporter, partial [Rubrimonas sp.]
AACPGLAPPLPRLGLCRVVADPAVASGTFVTTTCDVVGFFAFLSLATALLL